MIIVKKDHNAGVKSLSDAWDALERNPKAIKKWLDHIKRLIANNDSPGAKRDLEAYDNREMSVFRYLDK